MNIPKKWKKYRVKVLNSPDLIYYAPNKKCAEYLSVYNGFKIIKVSREK